MSEGRLRSSRWKTEGFQRAWWLRSEWYSYRMSKASGETLPAVSIIIPALNEEHYVPVLLESLSNIQAPIDIIVVDGTSTDGTVRVVEKFIPRFSGDRLLRVVSSGRGISRQRNYGTTLAKHAILLFLDADVVIPSPAHYEKMVATFERKKYVVASPLIEGLERHIVADLIYGGFHVLQRIYLFFGRAYFPGACMLTRKDVFTALGGFDTSHHVAEDLEYSLKAARYGTPGLLDVHIPTSTRRFKRYGYWSVCKTYTTGALRVMFTGRIPQRHTRYPFGEYAKPPRTLSEP